MIFKNKFRSYYDCRFVATRYRDNGNLALLIENDSDGQIAVCSVNPWERVGEGRLAVKDYSENAGMVDFLKGQGIIKGNPVYEIPSGFITIPVYELTDRGLALWGLERLSAK